MSRVVSATILRNTTLKGDILSDKTSAAASLGTILVVDDETDILRLADNILSAQGYHVLLSRGAEHATTLFTRLEVKPNLVLTDVVMPGVSGPMLVDRFLALTPAQRVLFMSGYDERQIVQKYVVERGFDLLPKPFTPAQLGAAVRNALKRPINPLVKGEPA